MRGTGCVAFYKSPEAAARERKAIDVWQQVVVCTTLLIAAGCSARRAPSLAIVTRWQPLSWPGGGAFQEVRSPMANGGAKSSKDSLIFVVTVLGKHKPRPGGLCFVCWCARSEV